MMNRKVTAGLAPRSRLTRWLGAAATGVAATVALGWFSPSNANAATPYYSATISVSPQFATTFGQAPSWGINNATYGTTSTGVFSAQLDNAGISQVYYATSTAGAAGPNPVQRCLTCTTVQGPNGLPQQRPPLGDWVLFESYGKQPVTHLGNAGLGGYGGDLYAMRPDGTQPYRLTNGTDPDYGAEFTGVTGTPYDNYHAYWSPDGNHVVWTHMEADSLLAGGQKWEMLLGDFSVVAGVPTISNVTVVGLPFGAYETEPWSPDGQGFIFFASGGRQSPFQSTAPGWGNSRIYYMRVFGAGASPANPKVTLLTDNAPNYTEQAVFTPDMQDVILMSNSTNAASTWTKQVMSAAQSVPFDDVNTGATQTLQFLADFDGTDFSADLYMVEGATLNRHQLTHTSQVIPEFFWDPTYTNLLWTQFDPTTNPPVGTSYMASFTGIVPANKTIPASTPPWILAKEVSINWSRVATQLQVPSVPLPNTSVPITPPLSPAAAFPHNGTNHDTASIPLVATTYVVPWQADLTLLSGLTFKNLAAPGLGRLGGL